VSPFIEEFCNMAEEEWDRLDINYLKDHFLEAATT